ncbi:MAG: RHS repeat-associated core domain-containing protein [Candidatus Acidiferrales bacterium]
MGYTYDLSGRVNSEWCQPCDGTYTGWGGGYVFLAGQMFAQYTDGTVYFTQTDHLGSTRLLTSSVTPISIVACYDYYPFGEIISCGATGDQSQKFTDYLRDSETNLDDANARYFASSLGRYMSPDPSGLYFADPTDPQTLNLYSYVRNNPLEFVDPFGLTTCDAEGNNCTDTVTVNGGDGCDLLCQLWFNIFYGNINYLSVASLTPPAPYAGLGGGGGTGGPSGPQSQAPCAEPNFLQKAEISVLGKVSTWLGKTVGIGAGGSAGAGYILGGAGAVSRFLIVSPNGQPAFLTTVGANTVPVGPTYGLGAFGGLQFTVSDAQSPSQLSGWGVTLGAAGGGAVLGGGGDFGVSSGGTWQFTGTVGAGAGGEGGAMLYENSGVTSLCTQ